MNNIANMINEAIDRSQSHNERVTVPVPAASLDEVIAACREHADDLDYACEADGTYDVWGWLDDTPILLVSWRLHVVLADDV